MEKNTSGSNFYKTIIEISENNTKNSFILTLTDEINTASKALVHTDHDGSIILDLVQDPGLEEYWRNLLKKIDLGSLTYKDSESSVFIESLSPKIQIVVCGGGHVSQALSKLCRFMNYDMIILEDREEFGNTKRFPDAKKIIVDSFDTIFKNNTFDPNACFIIATRGHSHDALCLENIMRLDFMYAGMIGSRAKIQKTKNLMLSKGFSQEDFANIHTPIGLPLGGQTPEEIAVSIIAEIIQTINSDHKSYLSDTIKTSIIDSHSPLVLAKIINKKGSSPRGLGSQMLIRGDGSIADTIGGGTIEYLCIQDAVKLLGQDKPRPFIKTYVLSNEEAAGIGMWCGGVVDILFDIV